MTIMVITVILGDLQGLLFKGHYIHFYEKNKLTITFISAQVNFSKEIVVFEISSLYKFNIFCGVKIFLMCSKYVFVDSLTSLE